LIFVAVQNCPVAGHLKSLSAGSIGRQGWK
jgi:hypothetical protein